MNRITQVNKQKYLIKVGDFYSTLIANVSVRHDSIPDLGYQYLMTEFSDNLVKWLQESGINYSIWTHITYEGKFMSERSKTQIARILGWLIDHVILEFENSADELLFKLTWL